MLAIATGPVLAEIGGELERRFRKLEAIRRLPRALRPMVLLFSSARPDGDHDTLIRYPPELMARWGIPRKTR